MHKLAAAFSSAANWLRAHKSVVLGAVIIGVFALNSVEVFALNTSDPAGAASNTPGASAYSGVPQNSVTNNDRSTLDAFLDGTIIIITLANILNLITSTVGSLIITLIDAILVPILNYNGFATSTIVDTGWSLVRDTVNMFVVVILLVIAVLTIVGSSKANWQQQIPRLFLFTLAVNFSRTICGVMIDVSNVIMFQFVNAIVAVGAGNMSQLLMLTSVGDYSEILAETQPIEAWQHFGGAYLQLALMLAVLGVILIMTIVFLYRIVILWILIIMSPLAFFAGGIKDIVGAAGSVYGDWMKKFTSALFLGPVLTFFLWLALSVSSSGTIVSKENFPVGEASTSFGLVLKVFEMSNITSLLLGLVLLVVGMQQAGTFAGNLGGIAGKLINEGMGTNLVKRALKLPGQAAYYSGREVARQVDRRGGAFMDRHGNTHLGSMSAHLGSSVMGVGELLRTSRVPGSSIVGRAFSSGGDRITRLGEASLHQAEENAEKREKNWSNSRRQSEMRIGAAERADGRTPIRLSNVDVRDRVFKTHGTTRSLQRDMEDDPAFEQVMTEDIRAIREQRDHFLETPADRDAFNATQSRYVDLVPPGDIQEFIDSADFNPRLMRAAALRGPNAAAVQAGLQNKTVGRRADGSLITAWDETLAGTYGNDNRAAALAFGRPTIDNGNVGALPPAPVVPPGTPPPPPPAPYTTQDLAANIRAGNIQVGTLTAADFTGPNGPNLSHAIVEVGANIDPVRNPAGHAAHIANATALADTGVLTTDQRARVDNYNLQNPTLAAPGHTTPEAIFEDRAAPGSYDVTRIGDAIHENVAAMRHLAAALASPQGNQVADTVTANLSIASIQRLGEQLRTANVGTRGAIAAAMTQTVEALRRNMARNAPPAGVPWEQHNRQLSELYAQARATSIRSGNPDPGTPP